MLITFLDVPAYQAVGIALASDVLASGVSAYTYHKNKNLDIKNGLVMMFTVLIFTFVGSMLASSLPSATMGTFSMVMTLLARHKVYCEAGYDNQRKNAGSISQKRELHNLLYAEL